MSYGLPLRIGNTDFEKSHVVPAVCMFACPPMTAAALNGNHNSSVSKTAIFRYKIKNGYAHHDWKAYPIFLFRRDDTKRTFL